MANLRRLYVFMFAGFKFSIFVSLFFCLIFFHVKPVSAQADQDEQVEQMPKFDGDLMQYLKDNIKYPKQAVDSNTQGTVFIELTISKTGDITDAKIKKDIGNGCGAEAERVVRNMPKWIPGKINGTPVNVKCLIRVKFVLSDDNIKIRKNRK